MATADPRRSRARSCSYTPIRVRRGAARAGERAAGDYVFWIRAARPYGNDRARAPRAAARRSRPGEINPRADSRGASERGQLRKKERERGRENVLVVARATVRCGAVPGPGRSTAAAGTRVRPVRRYGGRLCSA